MTVRHSRFMNIERPRSEGAGQGSPGADARFGALEQPGAAPVPSSAGTATERFRPPGAGGDGQTLELQERNPEDQPFVRCARCEADNAAHAASCYHCGAGFDSDEQRAFNEQLWERRRQERAREAEQLARMEQQRAAADAELMEQRRKMAEALAQQVGIETMRRLEREQFSDYGMAWGDSEAMLGRRLLEKVPLWLKQWLAIALALALLVLLIVPGTRMLAAFLLAFVAIIYIKISWGGSWRG